LICPQVRFRTTERLARNRVSTISLWRCVHWLLFSLVTFAAGSPVLPQPDPAATKPYATLDRQSVSYLGPARAPEKELPNSVAVIGMILPLQGPQQSEGKAILAAAQLSLEAEQSLGPLPDGRKLALVARDESGPWGQASTQILALVEQDHALALVTSPNGNSAHLAEQISNKIGFPILTLSSDPTTTETNIPWLFRLGPSDTDQARAFCQRIYAQLGIQKVLLIVQTDHDGRVGGEEFEKAASNLHATAPARLDLATSTPNLEWLGEVVQTKNPDAIVVWTDSLLARELLALLHKTRPSTPIFLCRKATEQGALSGSSNAARVSKDQAGNLGELFTLETSQKGRETARSEFDQLYLARTGTTPSIAAAEAYQAVHLIAVALRAAGANRVRLRDYFANSGKFREATGIMPFDPAGNSLQEFAIVKLRATSSPVTGQ
jgi:ABC-type branched-subunit amino acid transport system substrate-binding protein